MGMNVGMKLIGIDAMMDTFESLSEAEAESEYWVGSVVEYAAAVEKGTPFMQPQPYLGPSLQGVKVEQAMGSIFEQVAGGFDLEEGLFELAKEVKDRAQSNAPVRTGNLSNSIQVGSTIEAMRANSASNANSLT